jgi:rubrerythrin
MATESEAQRNMLAAALDKEEYGRDFYKKATEECNDQLAREVFKMLMIEEGIHIRRIKEIYESLQGGGAWSEDWKKHAPENENLQDLFRTRAMTEGSKVKADTKDIEAVNIGLDFEQGAIDFYQKEMQRSTDDKEKEFIEAMIAEERSHYASLADMKLYLTNPESWYTEAEKHTLDGA